MSNFSKYSLWKAGLTVDQILSIKNTILSGSFAADIASGKTVSSVNVPGLSTSFALYANPVDVLEACNYALSILDPSTYGNSRSTSTAIGVPM